MALVQPGWLFGFGADVPFRHSGKAESTALRGRGMITTEWASAERGRMAIIAAAKAALRITITLAARPSLGGDRPATDYTCLHVVIEHPISKSRLIVLHLL